MHTRARCGKVPASALPGWCSTHTAAPSTATTELTTSFEAPLPADGRIAPFLLSLFFFSGERVFFLERETYTHTHTHTQTVRRGCLYDGGCASTGLTPADKNRMRGAPRYRFK